MELPEVVDMKTAYLHEIIEEVDGLEISREQFIDSGERVSRIETDYNPQGLVAEIREFTDDFAHPFKVDRFHYSPEGKLLMEQVFHDEVQTLGLQYVYDQLGRLTLHRSTDDEGIHHDVIYHYDIAALHAKTAQYVNNNECWKEVHYKYSEKGDRSRVIEETIEDKKDKFQSRIIRYYEFGEKENGVVAEYYNTNGRFIEEERQIRDHKGNILQEATYTDEAADAIPYTAAVSKYDVAGNCIFIESSYHGRVNMRQLSSYDNGKRKLMDLTSGTESSLLIYKYEDA